MREVEIVSSSYYHVFNRGVDKRHIFESPKDKDRFVESMYLFNDEDYETDSGDPLFRMIGLASAEVVGLVRKPLVKVVSFNLQSNHFHMELKQNSSGGISQFLHRLSMGHAKFYNKKYDRTGRLFESSFKAVPVDFDEHFLHLPRYIHLNALDGTGLDWRNGTVDDWEKAKMLLNIYPWSSHHVYAGKQQVLPVVDVEEVRRLFPTPELYWDYLKAWAGRHTIPFQVGDDDR